MIARHFHWITTATAALATLAAALLLAFDAGNGAPVAPLQVTAPAGLQVSTT